MTRLWKMHRMPSELMKISSRSVDMSSLRLVLLERVIVRVENRKVETHTNRNRSMILLMTPSLTISRKLDYWSQKQKSKPLTI